MLRVAVPTDLCLEQSEQALATARGGRKEAHSSFWKLGRIPRKSLPKTWRGGKKRAKKKGAKGSKAVECRRGNIRKNQ